MSTWAGLKRWLTLPERLRPVEREVDAEVGFHIESRIEDLIVRGATRAEAREQAAREFGDVDAARRELTTFGRRQRSRRRLAAPLDALRMDVAYALRGIARAPAFALTVILTLALGIGANATMFGIIDRLMLRPAPHVAGAERLRRVFHRVTYPAMGTVTQTSRSYPDLVDLQRERDIFDGVAGYWSVDVSIGRGVDARKGRAMLVTAGFFPLLGVDPALGRFISEDEDRPPRGSNVIVLSYGFWQRVFGGDPSALGSTLDAMGDKFTIVGVAPPAFRGVGTQAVDFFVPMSAVASKWIASRTDPLGWRSAYDWSWLIVIARVAPGVTEESALARATTIFRRAHQKEEELAKAEMGMASVIPGRGPEQSPEDQVTLWLVGVAAVVLLIATANVANLLLTRAAKRRREIALRIALGISRRRLFGQLLVESVLLALLGASAALALTRWGGSVVRAVLLPNLSPDDAVVDTRVFLVAALVALVSGVLAGLAPIWFSTRSDVNGDLKSGSREGTYHRSRLRVSLLVAQAALSVVLIVGAALFVRSLRNATSRPLGYDTKKVLVAEIDLASVGMSGRPVVEYFRQARDRVRQLREVESASLAATVPFYSSWSLTLGIDGLDSIPQQADGGPYINAVTADYFETMGMRLRRGRLLSDADVLGGPPVAVINETMASTLWRGRDPIGTCLYVGGEKGKPRPSCTQVVGIVSDARRTSIGREKTLLYYTALAQDTATYAPTLMVRVRANAPVAAKAVAREMQSLAANLPYADVRPLQDLVDPLYRSWKLGATLFVIFGGIALLLAAVGLYSVVAYDAAQRSHEFGVRIALGARGSQILRIVVVDGLRSAGLGTALGLAVAMALGGSVASLLFDVSPRDPTVLAAAGAIMMLVGGAASAWPAWRATKIPPGEALRAD